MINEMEKIMTFIEPDWTKSPFWAKWWGVNCDKFPEGDDIWACWYENEPKFKSGIWVSPRGRGQEDNAWQKTECDDYRQTLRSRPAMTDIQPNWLNAPDWAGWWAMDRLTASWYEQKPRYIKVASGMWVWYSQGVFEQDSSIHPKQLIVDYRQTLQCRP